MKELFVTADPVFLSLLRFELSEENIAFDIFDSFTGALFPGDQVFTGQRVMVSDEDYSRARYLLDRLQNEP